eukprot:TRINITY_DN30057_c0_g1_i1.p1 TRINITY_DN30057_c0_g1~~TRINITY_DN30057_c0_g1_i1.p1  ORF type:complete len:739 (-),score=72.46 TRINITY_DN30057_c0_g1_i1:55-2271(-)
MVGVEALLVRSKFTNIAGIYEFLRNDKNKYPQYKRLDGQAFIYKMYGEHWAISAQLGSNRAFFLVEHSRAKTPLKVPEWTGADASSSEHELIVLEIPKIDTTDVPELVHVVSKYSNVDGGYARIDDFERYPAYFNEEKGLYLQHFLGLDAWRITTTLGDPNAGFYNACTSSAVNVVHLASQLWDKPEGITEIEPVTWADAQLEDNGFVDGAFPPNHSSLGDAWLARHKQYAESDSIEWIRAPDLNRDAPEDLFGPISPEDITQGKVGNCWLIAAISCVAEFPNTIQGLIEPKDLAEDGKYTVWLYCVGLSQWVAITVDDLVPCEKRRVWEWNAKPLFSRITGDFIWPLILEKAVAKYCGSYGSLEGGIVARAWQILTGIEEQHWFKRDAQSIDKWLMLELSVVQQKYMIMNGDRTATPWYKNGVSFGKMELWSALRHSFHQNYLMGASIDSNNEREHERPDGLIEGHAYSLISAKEIKTEGGVFRLLKLRNPWGEKEWNGAWSDDAPEWEEYPQVTKELQPESSTDGCFWIDLDDFITAFTSVFVSPRPTVRARTNFLSLRGNGLARLMQHKRQKPEPIPEPTPLNPQVPAPLAEPETREEQGVDPEVLPGIDPATPAALPPRIPSVAPVPSILTPVAVPQSPGFPQPRPGLPPSFMPSTIPVVPQPPLPPIGTFPQRPLPPVGTLPLGPSDGLLKSTWPKGKRPTRKSLEGSCEERCNTLVRDVEAKCGSLSDCSLM